MLPFRLVYHDRYDLNLGEHVFPARKYRWLKDRILRTRFAGPEDFVEPEPASDADIQLVHDAEYVTKLRTGTLSYHEILRLEIPYSRQMVEAFWLGRAGPFWRRDWRWKTAWDSILGADFTTRFRHTGKVFALSTILAWRYGSCNRKGISSAP